MISYVPSYERIVLEILLRVPQRNREYQQALADAPRLPTKQGHLVCVQDNYQEIIYLWWLNGRNATWNRGKDAWRFLQALYRFKNFYIAVEAVQSPLEAPSWADCYYFRMDVWENERVGIIEELDKITNNVFIHLSLSKVVGIENQTSIRPINGFLLKFYHKKPTF